LILQVLHTIWSLIIKFKWILTGLTGVLTRQRHGSISLVGTDSVSLLILRHRILIGGTGSKGKEGAHRREKNSGEAVLELVDGEVPMGCDGEEDVDDV
jgi:hypothetical protein